MTIVQLLKPAQPLPVQLSKTGLFQEKHMVILIPKLDYETAGFWNYHVDVCTIRGVFPKYF
jgi:hypothetical protein